MNVTTQQLAELLIGVARSQQAVIDAIEAQKPGFKATYLAPALDGVAKSVQPIVPPRCRNFRRACCRNVKAASAPTLNR